ncbi:MAG: hypothetical protein EAX96_01775 [Candidatus Lokiarchaeota archaeon]|nr:hypothetical protein [Candidatus Lokiarchaeota archaeon]
MKISVEPIFNLNKLKTDFKEFITKKKKYFPLSENLKRTLPKYIENLIICFLLKKIEIEIDVNSTYFDKYSRQLFTETQISLINEIITNLIKKYSDFSLINEYYLNQLLKERVSMDLEKIKEGIVYTPSNIVDRILTNTLEKQIKDLSFDNLIKYKLGDLSCGTGVFLFSSLKILKNSYINHIKSFKEQGIYEKICTKYPLIDNLDLFIILNNINGYDIDAFALNILKICFFSLISKNNEKFIMSYEKFKNQLDKKIKNINIFILNNDEIENKMPKFDLIVGNPPYVSWSHIKQYRKIFENGSYMGCKFDFRPSHEDTQPNLYLFFLIFSLNRLKKNGNLGYIIPTEWLNHEKAKKIRDFIIMQNRDIEIEQFTDQTKIFKINQSYIGTNSLILFIRQKNKLPTISYSNIEIDLSNNIIELNKKRIFSLNLLFKPWIFLDERLKAVKNEIISNKDLIYLSDTNHFLVKSGFQPPMKEALNYFTFFSHEMEKLTEGEMKHVHPVILNSNEIKEYYLADPKRFWIVLNNEFNNESEFKTTYPNIYRLLRSKSIKNNRKLWWEFPNVRNLHLYKTEVPKIISPRVSSKNRFALDFNKSIIKGTNSIIISKNLSYFYLLGIFNSRLANFWYKNFGFSYHGVSRRFEPAKLKNYFLPIINGEDTLICLFSKIIYNLESFEEKKCSNLIANSKKILDLLVYELYFKSIVGLNLANHLNDSYNMWINEINCIGDRFSVEKTNLISKFLNKLSNDPIYLNLINTILNNELIKIIEME